MTAVQNILAQLCCNLDAYHRPSSSQADGNTRCHDRIGYSAFASTVGAPNRGLADNSWNLAILFYANFFQDRSMMLMPPSVPQPTLGDRTFELPLGPTVGGGSTVNGMAVTRGSKEDYDAWEQVGSPGWRWDEVLGYFRKVAGPALRFH